VLSLQRSTREAPARSESIAGGHAAREEHEHEQELAMKGRAHTRTLGVLAVLALTAPLALAVRAGASSPSKLPRNTIRVPKDLPTIQQAVDAARPGTLVLVAPGVYNEGVTVGRTHHDIVIRGEDRGTTILDGKFSTAAGQDNGFQVRADGVAIENITARNFANNGFFWEGVDGYRGSYLTAVRNGNWDIYSSGSVHGQFDHDYASGTPDAGFYIGECNPCHAVITDVEAEWNGLGYLGTNAGGDLVIMRSKFHDNRAGIVPNSETGEKLSPQRGVTIVGNTVYSNNNVQTAAPDIANIATGSGILLAGGNDDVVERNVVRSQAVTGIGVIPLPEKILNPSNPNAKNFTATGNQVRDNVLSNNLVDLILVSSFDDATQSGRNCFSGNHPTSSLPAGLEQVLPCSGTGAGTFTADIPTFLKLLLAPKPTPPDFKTLALPDPPALPNMPGAATATARPARHLPKHVNPGQVAVPPA